MIKKLLFLLLLAGPYVTYAQITHETLNSTKLGETRQIKIQLPRNYDANKEKSYPVMVVLDGDYLFEPVAGNVDYYSYWEDIPEMIVVGINQASSREDDGYYDEQRFLPAGPGAAFFEFIGMELIPHLEKKYRTAPFRVIIGHDFTANFMNYYLLKENPLFQGYINLSPDLAPEMITRLADVLDRSSNKTWYYLATGSEDIPQLKEGIMSLDEKLKNLNNKNINYQFDNFEGATHYSLVGMAIPKAIEQIFQVYRPISLQDYNRILLQTSVSGYDYLIEKYETIEELFGLQKQIRLNDFMAVYNAMEKTRNWDGLRDLSKLASKHYPKTMLATYFEARYEEEIGNPKKAMRSYQNAYGQEPVAFLTVDFMLDKAEAIKRDFGY
ncbi:esterase [Antarcticibacterium flavum]|uniref:Esterase n=1 Tax=Antarcticibacterium flavum TaxID=2058175 RepID=A0A5B7X3H2_9FLAO|nr:MULTISPECIES: alpha/beta hydrolase-fold protein [Antarcticibacterium]MCM4160548.1 esterase [Antarcticibacterium sp. W02-3]QCY69790.1 esterase [Antarcticibacterium flavum]